MFYGVALKPGQTVTVSPQDGGEVLHLSQVCMPHAKDNGKTYVQVTQEGKTFSICMLQKDSQESAQLDLFLSTRQGLSLKAEGAKNEVHVTGYFEPSADLGESSDEESDEDEVSDEMMEAKRVVPKKGGKIEDLDKLNDDEEEDEDDDDDDDDDESSSAKPLTQGSGEDDDDEDEDDDDDEADVNGIESGSEDEEEEDEEEQHPQQPKGDKKRKAQESSASTQAAAGKGAAANKKPKTAGSPQQKQKQGSTGGDANTYKNSLVEYLKKNGKTPLATLGQKVKKPAGVTEKMAQFLKSHATTFDVSNGFCALKA